jgi:hypothetical protein
MIPGALRIAMEEIEERHGEIPRSRRRSLLLVTQRSDQRPGGAAAASQRNHQGSPARRRDRRLARGQFPIRHRKPRQETRCPLREGIFRSRVVPTKIRNVKIRDLAPDIDPYRNLTPGSAPYSEARGLRILRPSPFSD